MDTWTSGNTVSGDWVRSQAALSTCCKATSVWRKLDLRWLQTVSLFVGREFLFSVLFGLFAQHTKMKSHRAAISTHDFPVLKMFVGLPWCLGCERGAGTPPYLQRTAALFTDNRGHEERKTHTWQHPRVKHKDKHSDTGRVLLNLRKITLKANMKTIRSFVQLFATYFLGFFGWPQHQNLSCRAALLEIACAHNP